MNLGRTCEAMVIEADRLERQGLIPEAIAAYERLLTQ